jgi:hypothetical protein
LLIKRASLLSPDNSKEDTMKRWVEIFENIFVSVTFAEMGEHRSSIEILEMAPGYSPELRGDGCVCVPVAAGG